VRDQHLDRSSFWLTQGNKKPEPALLRAMLRLSPVKGDLRRIKPDAVPVTQMFVGDSGIKA
jgi:hypothetical protein